MRSLIAGNIFRFCRGRSLNYRTILTTSAITEWSIRHAYRVLKKALNLEPIFWRLTKMEIHSKKGSILEVPVYRL